MSKENKKTLLSIGLFALIFGALLVLATFYDLQVSQILTKRSLSDGNFHTDEWYANFFEAAGMFPAYLGTASVCLIVFGLFYSSGLKKPLKAILCFLTYIVGVYLFKDAFSDLFGFPMNHIEGEYGVSAKGMDATWTALSFFLSALCFGLMIAATRKVPLAVWKRLILFAIAFSVASFACGTLVDVLKKGVGRVRYRTLYWGEKNGVGNGFADYTPWYKKTGNGAYYEGTEVSKYHDAFNSFPSHHTRAAGLSYASIMLIDVLPVRKKGQKAILWIAPILWTGLTAVGRIVAGAHYFSDVLIGGTSSFVCMILSREIFICRFSHVRGFFKRK